MNLSAAGNLCLPSTAPSVYELGVKLYSSRKLIESIINKEKNDDSCLFLLVNKGDCRLSINTARYECSRGLIIISPEAGRRQIQLNDIFSGYLFCIPSLIVSDSLPPVSFSQLNGGDVVLFKNYYYLMREVLVSSTYKYSGMELLCLCRAFAASCHQYYGSSTRGKRPRPTEICDDFMTLVELHCSKKRDLVYYANLLDISPKYLSAVISKTTEKTAGKWIGEYAVSHAKRLLLNTKMSVAEVAESMNFKSSSEFCRYFRNNTGQTPGSIRSQNNR